MFQVEHGLVKVHHQRKLLVDEAVEDVAMMRLEEVEDNLRLDVVAALAGMMML
jgi:hypothetical protein